MDIPQTLNEAALSAWLSRIMGAGEEVNNAGRDTVILLLRLNLAIDDLRREIRNL
jgi:hypothetical protein